MNLYTHSILFHSWSFILNYNFENASTETGEMLVGKIKRTIQHNSNRKRKTLMDQIDKSEFARELSYQYSISNSKSTYENMLHKKWENFIWEEISFSNIFQQNFFNEINYLLTYLKEHFTSFTFSRAANGDLIFNTLKEILEFQKNKINWKKIPRKKID